MPTIKSISQYPANETLESGDLYLVQKGTAYKKRPLSAHIATQAEVDAGTNTKNWVTPDTLSNYPRTDLGVFDFGMLLVNAQPTNGETFTIAVDGETVIFEFTAGGGLTTGDVEVVKGGTTALTAAAWITAINTSILSLEAIVNPVTANQINWITGNANESVTLTDGTSGDIKFSSANDERAAANTIPIYREYVVTAADVTAGTIMLRFPVSSFPEGVMMVVNVMAGDAFQSNSAHGDTYTISGGDVNITILNLVAGEVIKVFGIGVRA